MKPAIAEVSLRSPWRVYDLLLDALPNVGAIEEVIIGLTWTLSSTASRVGLAMSPVAPTRLLPWPGTLGGRDSRDLAGWVRSWNPHEAAVGMATINALINTANPLAEAATPIFSTGAANLSVFEHFRSQLCGQRVVVVGRYPGLDSLQQETELTVIERSPGDNDLPDPAAEYLIPQADWVFLTASSLTNKTFPRLAELATDTKLVLMGPTTPWLAELQGFGVDYLAGVLVTDPLQLRSTVSEGGGTRLFDAGVRYAVADLAADPLTRLKSVIASVAAERDRLKQAMEGWYRDGNRGFPQARELAAIDRRLSELDSRYKSLCDADRESVAA